MEKLLVDRPKVLDIGCSSGGTFSELFLRFVESGLIDYHGIDPDEYLLRLLKDAWGKYEDVHLHATDLSGFGSQLGQFDIAVLSYTYHHLPDAIVSMEKIHSLLRPGGTFFFVDDYNPNQHECTVHAEPLEPIMEGLKKIFDSDSELNEYLGYIKGKEFNIIYRNPEFESVARQIANKGFVIDESFQTDGPNDKKLFFICARKLA